MHTQPLRHAIYALIAALLLLTGCSAAMSQANDPAHGNTVPTPWPLTFKGSHTFDAECYNTLRCRVVYNDHLFTRAYLDAPAPAPDSGDYRSQWVATYIVSIGSHPFPPAAEVRWTSLDGMEHQAKVDMGAIFKDRMILHKVPREEIPEGWQPGPGLPRIYLEVNDRTLSVYMQESVTTKTPQISGNPRSTHRRDVMLAWTHTY